MRKGIKDGRTGEGKRGITRRRGGGRGNGGNGGGKRRGKEYEGKGNGSGPDQVREEIDAPVVDKVHRVKLLSTDLSRHT